MRRADLARAVHHRHGGLTLQESTELVDSIIQLLRGSVVQEGRVSITGFGSLKVQHRKPRSGINPHTGQRMLIPDHRTIVFKPSKILLDRINSGR